MATEARTALLEKFFTGISHGVVDDALLSEDMTFWSINGGQADKTRFLGGISLLARVAEGSLKYVITLLVEEGDRLVAEVSSSGRLMDGSRVKNQHVFLFTLRDEKIAAVSEYMNQRVVAEQIAPLMQQLMTAQSKN